MNSRVERLRIPYYEEQARVAAEAIRGGHLVSGPHLDKLRTRLAAMFRKRYVTLTANGFAAIFVALKAAGAAAGGVLTAPVSTCHAVTNAIRAAGRAPVFADVEAATASLAAHGENIGPLAVVPDHFGLIAGACREPGASALLIEDASQSFVSRARTDTPAKIVTLSFYPTKLANGIDGGALLTDDERIHEAAGRLVQYTDQHGEEADPRYNFKLNNVNAAVALATLDALPAVEARLRAIYETLARDCDARGVEFLRARDAELVSRFVVVARDAAHKQAWMQRCDQAGVQAASELEMLCSPARTAAFPAARRLAESSFSLPFHPLLGEAEVDRVRAAIALS